MKRFLIFVILVTLAVYSLYRWTENHRQVRQPEKFTPAESARLSEKETRGLLDLDEQYQALVDSVVPSVVSITTAKRVRAQTPMLIDPFEQFFGRRFRNMPQERVQNSLGSGVIVSKEGHIITNNHVIADVDEAKVQLSDGRTLPAKLIGTDPGSDIAVLKIDAPNLIPMPFGDSDKVRVGQRVIAVGNPFGFEETVTDGIISAKGRRAMDDSTNEFFQTNAAINPGNSGGPLVNMRGEIVGINSAIFSSSGSPTAGWQGIGFAIPANTARRVLESILTTGRVVRGYLGVAIQQITPELAAQFGLKDMDGVLVSEVTADSPAQKAGIKSGDVIRQFNGHSIKDIRELRSRVAQLQVGAKAKVVVQRAGKEMEVTAEIAEQPDNLQARQGIVPQTPTPAQPILPPPPAPPAPPAPKNPPPAQSASNVLAGVRVSEIPAEHRADLPENARGVMVTAVDPDSPAAESLQVGDVIEEVNRQPVASVEDFQKTTATLKPGEKQMLFICRGKTRSFVVLTPR